MGGMALLVIIERKSLVSERIVKTCPFVLGMQCIGCAKDAGKYQKARHCFQDLPSLESYKPYSNKALGVETSFYLSTALEGEGTGELYKKEKTGGNTEVSNSITMLIKAKANIS